MPKEEGVEGEEGVGGEGLVIVLGEGEEVGTVPLGEGAEEEGEGVGGRGVEGVDSLWEERGEEGGSEGGVNEESLVECSARLSLPSLLPNLPWRYGRGGARPSPRRTATWSRVCPVPGR